jgi:alkyldihydroxyacetonephosphate synthase
MHWARWGDPEHAAPLAESARTLVEMAFGPAEQRAAVPIEDVRVPESRLADRLLEELSGVVGAEHVHTDHDTRVRHTRGRSTPDLLRMRAGDAAHAPDAVALPGHEDEVQRVVSWCTERRVALVPFGGGTSVVGGLDAPGGGFAGVLAVDLRRLDGFALDEESGTAELGAGLRGPDAERLLAERGWTLGHFPQSFEYASVGGFAATRSSGQASSGYGRFDANVVALRVATPIGPLALGTAPASAAGPDLRQLMLGSEGAFGVITSVTVRVRRAPAERVYEGWRLTDFDSAVTALRDVVRSGRAPAVLRLSDENETALNLADPAAVGAESGGGCLLLTGHEGHPDRVAEERAAVAAVLDGRATALGTGPGEAWLEGRYRGPYLRDSLLDAGVLVETLETAAFWSRLPAVYAAVRTALERALTTDAGGPVVLCHVSHVYDTGASLYFTVAARQHGDGLAQWQHAKAAATDAIVAAGGTITHHHAVGRDHRPWLESEIGPVGVEILRAVKQRLDPAGVLNPGVLVP